MTRRIPFDGIHNFRDFGDYPARGGRLKRGRLYRAANQAQATDADLARMAELSLSVIVDLRRDNERERDPSRRWQGFAATVIDNDLPQSNADAWNNWIGGEDHSVEAHRAFMADYYRAAPFQTRHIDLYRRYFHALAETDGAVLVHCTAGKDRTGIICALTHHLAGVPDELIVEDFLLTNDPERMAARLPIMRQMIADSHGGRVPPDDALIAAMGVEADYLRTAFEVMTEAHGSIDGYLEEALGLDTASRDRIHERLLD
jgi:protein-tyrosine phosphatase